MKPIKLTAARTPKTVGEALAAVRSIGEAQRWLNQVRLHSAFWKKKEREARAEMEALVAAVNRFCVAERTDPYKFIAEALGMSKEEEKSGEHTKS